MSSLAERLYVITKRHPTLVNKGKLAEKLGISRSMLYSQIPPAKPGA
jgi:biotin operon repressor